METQEIKKALRLHGLWMRGDRDGKCADLSGADLSRAYLRSANLRGAYLRGANLPAGKITFVPEGN